MEKAFITVEEAAARLGVSAERIAELVAEGKLREFRDRQVVLLKASMVDELAISKAAESAGDTAEA